MLEYWVQKHKHCPGVQLSPQKWRINACFPTTPERLFLVSLQALTPHLGSKTVLGGLNEIGALLNDYIPNVFRWGFLPRCNLHWLISNHRSHTHSSWIQERKHQAPSDFRRCWCWQHLAVELTGAAHCPSFRTLPLTWLKHACCLAMAGPAEVTSRVAFGEVCAIHVDLFKIYRLTLFYPCSSDQTLNWNCCHGN